MPKESFMKLINMRCRLICSVLDTTLQSRCDRSRVYYIRLLFYIIMSVDWYLSVYTVGILRFFYVKAFRTISVWRFYETFLFKQHRYRAVSFFTAISQSVEESIVYGIRLRFTEALCCSIYESKVKFRMRICQCVSVKSVIYRFCVRSPSFNVCREQSRRDGIL